jgi:hypothetical protein
MSFLDTQKQPYMTDSKRRTFPRCGIQFARFALNHASFISAIDQQQKQAFDNMKASQNPVSNILIKLYTTIWTLSHYNPVSITMFTKTNMFFILYNKVPVGGVFLAGDGLNLVALLSNIALNSTFMRSNASSISSVFFIQQMSEHDDDAVPSSSSSSCSSSSSYTSVDSFENKNQKSKNEQKHHNKKVVDSVVAVAHNDVDVASLSSSAQQTLTALENDR